MSSFQSDTGSHASRRDVGGLYRGVYNTASLRVPGTPEHFLSNRTHTTDFNDFNWAADLDIAGDWTDTDIGTNTTTPAIQQDTGASVLALGTSGVANTGTNLIRQNKQWRGRTDPKTIIVFEARIGVEDWAAMDIFVGLCGVDTPMAATGVLTGANVVGFHNLESDGSDVPNCISHDNLGAKTNYGPAGTTDNITNANLTGQGQQTGFVNLGFRFSGQTGIEFYRDGLLVASGESSVNINGPMAPTFCMTGSGDATDRVWIDFYTVSKPR